MSPRLRLLLFAIFGAVVSIAVGVDIAEEVYGVAILVGIAAGWLILKKVSSVPPDAWMLAAIIVGYVVGNRGFAQLQPSAQLPLLPAEAVLLVAVPSLLVRMALKQSVMLPHDRLNYSVLGWIIIGTLRLPVDMHFFGFMALRDFATIYYALFFFIAQDLATRSRSAGLLKRSLTLSFVLLLPVIASTLIAPDFLIDNLTWRGIPIIYHKSDLIATSLAAGFFWLWTRWEKSHHRIWLVPAAASLLLIGVMASPRAGMFAIGLTTLLWLCTGKWRIGAAQLGIITAGIVVSLAFIMVTGRDVETSIPYSMYEHAVSIFDPAGTGTYINGESGELGGNNRFRLIWWRDVTEDTLATSPLMGLGFGSDLSTRFLADYDLLTDENFAARSPHSIIVTVIGRMGLVGLAGWVAVSGSMFVMAWRLLKRGQPDGMGLASIVLVVWLSACFGVVLEGPMGAVLFWTVLGLANAESRLPSLSGRASPEKRYTSTESAEWHVAKEAEFGSESAAQ